MKAFTRERVSVGTGLQRELEDDVLVGELLTRGDGEALDASDDLARRRAVPHPRKAAP